MEFKWWLMLLIGVFALYHMLYLVMYSKGEPQQKFRIKRYISDDGHSYYYMLEQLFVFKPILFAKIARPKEEWMNYAGGKSTTKIPEIWKNHNPVNIESFTDK